jgi:4-nitrophenyl phosphatase
MGMTAHAVQSIRPIRLVIFDLHGVICGRRVTTPEELSAAQVIASLRQHGALIRFVSNTSSRGPREVARILAECGIAACLDEIATAGQAMAVFLSRYYRGKRVFLIGQLGLRRLVEESCGQYVQIDDGSNADVVVVGRDPELSEVKLRAATGAAESGASLLATSVEESIPDDGGDQPGPGPTVRRVERAMGRPARIVGKPDSFVLEHVLGLDRALLRESLVVGDSTETDISLGARVGASTVLLAQSSFVRHRSSPQPDWVLQRLDQVLSIPGVAHGNCAASTRNVVDL